MTPDSAPITVLIVDDHFVVRSGIAASLGLTDDIQVIAETDRAEEVIGLYAAHRPSVVLMDIELPGASGPEATAALKAAHPEARVLLFSSFLRDHPIRQALDAGAAGFVSKSGSRDELLTAIRCVAAGGRYIADEFKQRFEGQAAEGSLSAREREILELVAQGRANKEIGASLQIAEDTVKRHVSNILDKLGVNDRAQATAEAIRRGIIRLP